jgi:capsular polysaccharide biosynthesis protein
MRQQGYPKTKASASSALRQILIVHRAEVIRRQVKNHGEMLQAIKVAFPGYSVVEFIGKNFTIQESFEQFRRSDVVVAAHGAALTFALTMKPGSSLVELLFKDTRRNSHMSYDMYRGTAHQLGVNYALSICKGSFESSLKANISDVVRLVGELEAAATADASAKIRGGP